MNGRSHASPVGGLIDSCLVYCRSADLPTRQRYVALVEGVKDSGGVIRIFSSLHVSGEREWPPVFHCTMVQGEQILQRQSIVCVCVCVCVCACGGEGGHELPGIHDTLQGGAAKIDSLPPPPPPPPAMMADDG